MEKTGRAYGFFSCKDPKEEVERSIRCIRDNVTGPDMELNLRYMHEFIADPKSPAKLVKLLDEVAIEAIGPSSMSSGRKYAGPVLARDLKYVIEASQRNKSNREVAQGMNDVMNHLYDEDEPFYATRVFERNGSYKELTE